MSRMGQVERMDLMAMPVFLACVLLNLQLVDDPTGGYLSMVLWEHGEATTAFTLATLIGLMVIGYVLYTNNFSLSVAGGVTIWTVVIVVGLMLAPPFLPIVSDLITETAGAWVAFALQAAGYVVISFMG